MSDSLPRPWPWWQRERSFQSVDRLVAECITHVLCNWPTIAAGGSDTQQQGGDTQHKGGDKGGDMQHK
eukprot:552976-Alexandrium_andersonii.AAC.1